MLESKSNFHQKMAYSHFTYDKIRRELGIQDLPRRLFGDLKPVEPSPWLRETLAKAEMLAYFSEKSRSEAVIFPILLEIWEQNNRSFAVYSGADLDAEASKGLSGECDFILGKGHQKMELDAPLFCMVEAKDQDMKKAIPQCIAQMEGARIFNEVRNMPILAIWGCVTTGEVWLFMKLVQKVVYIDTHRYQSAQLHEVLGALQRVLEENE